MSDPTQNILTKNTLTPEQLDFVMEDYLPSLIQAYHKSRTVNEATDEEKVKIYVVMDINTEDMSMNFSTKWAEDGFGLEMMIDSKEKFACAVMWGDKDNIEARCCIANGKYVLGMSVKDGGEPQLLYAMEASEAANLIKADDPEIVDKALNRLQEQVMAQAKEEAH